MFDHVDDVNPYLQQEVLSASPVRLRWMLIRRAEELCGVVQHLWGSGEAEQATQWLLRIREILGELLDGVTDAENPLSKTVADFYIFLIQLAVEVEETRDSQRLATLRELLAIELETWRQVIETTESGATAQETGSAKPTIAPLGQDDTPLSGGAFNLEI